MSTEQYQKQLQANAIGFDVKNEGLHLIVEGQNSLVDVWPTSGKWICRSTRQQGFGLRELLLYCTKGESLQVHTFQRTIKLELSKTTAAWLKGMMQNPLYCSPESEPEEDSRARKEIWEGLQGVHL